MRYSLSINETQYNNSRNKCFAENCYCKPFNNPLEVRHSISLDTIKKLINDDSVTNFEIYQDGIYHAPLTNPIPYDVGVNGLDIYHITEYLNDDSEKVLVLNMKGQPEDNCFYVGIDIVVTTAVGFRLVTLWTEPYCRVGSSCFQTFRLTTTKKVNPNPLTFTLSNGSSISFDITQGSFDCAAMPYLFITVAPDGTVFFNGNFDPSLYGGNTITHINGVPLDFSFLSCHTENDCEPFFRIISNRPEGYQCSGDYFESNYDVMLIGLSSVTAISTCGENIFTVKGSIDVLPNTFTTQFAGDSCIVVGSKSTKNIGLYSSNNEPIATWAINELGGYMTGKNIRIQSPGSHDIDDCRYIFRDETYWVRPVEKSGNNYLSATLTSCECENFFVC